MILEKILDFEEEHILEFLEKHADDVIRITGFRWKEYNITWLHDNWVSVSGPDHIPHHFHSFEEAIRHVKVSVIEKLKGILK